MVTHDTQSLHMTQFSKITSKVLSSGSPSAIANGKAWADVLQEYQAALETASSQGNAQSIAKHDERGQLLGRDVLFFSIVRLTC